MTTSPTGGPFRIDYFYALHHRRLRERFQMTTVVHHETRLADALAKRHALALAEGKKTP